MRSAGEVTGVARLAHDLEYAERTVGGVIGGDALLAGSARLMNAVVAVPLGMAVVWSRAAVGYSLLCIAHDSGIARAYLFGRRFMSAPDEGSITRGKHPADSGFACWFFVPQSASRLRRSSGSHRGHSRRHRRRLHEHALRPDHRGCGGHGSRADCDHGSLTASGPRALPDRPPPATARKSWCGNSHLIESAACHS